MPITNQILENLYDHDRWWSLEELARVAGVGAIQIDRALGELGKRGHRLEFHPARGIRLGRPPALDNQLIERDLGTVRIGRHVLCFPAVDSTNDTAFQAARQAGSDGLVVLAEAQKQGRGRRGRHWLSPPGANILMSALVKDPRVALVHESLTVAAGLAVAEGIEQALPHGVMCRLKWPNDVLLEGRKFAGILVERHPAGRGANWVIGMGINVNAQPPRSDLALPATSLAAAVGEQLDRIPIARAVLRRLDAWVLLLSSAAGAAAAVAKIRTGWAARCGMLNEWHTIRAGRRHITGRVVDIDPVDGLVLLTDAGAHVRVLGREATVVE